MTFREFSQTYAQPLKLNGWLLAIVCTLVVAGLIQHELEMEPLCVLVMVYFILFAGWLINGGKALGAMFRKRFKLALVYGVAALLLFMPFLWLAHGLAILTAGL